MWNFGEFSFTMSTVGSKTMFDVEEGMYAGGRMSTEEFTASAVHLVVQSFFCVGDHPTLNRVLAKCQEENIDFPDIGSTSLWFRKLMKSIGFRSCKTRGNWKTMMEKPDILAWRHRYLHHVRELSSSSHPHYCLL